MTPHQYENTFHTVVLVWIVAWIIAVLADEQGRFEDIVRHFIQRQK